MSGQLYREGKEQMQQPMSRRALLKVMGALPLYGALAACVPIQAPSETAGRPSPPPVATPAPLVVAELGADDEERIQKIDALFDALQKSGFFSGVALIAREGELLLDKGYGLADRTNEVANTPQTIFHVGELTMQFTAAAILLLEAEGKLGVQEPISTYLADVPETWQEISLHHLLSHSSGIPDYVDSAAAFELRQSGATPDQLPALFRDKPLNSAPGELREFNHADFVVAGLILEQVSGQAYGDFVKEHLFDPLQMSNSGYGEPPAEMALGYQTGYGVTPVDYNVSLLYSAGGCYSCADDLYRWNEALYNGKAIPEAQVEKMLTRHIYDEVEEFWAGYGIAILEEDGQVRAAHAGGPDGYSHLLMRFIEEGVTLLMLGNQNSELQYPYQETVRTLFGQK